MTHDELIAYIDDSTDGLKHEHLFEKLLANTNALRAVVKLCNFLDKKGHCCVPVKEVIQAIEKELK